MLRCINIVLKGNPLDCPFAPNKKQLGAAAITAVGGLLGSILGSQSQSDANSANMRMAKENNETQIYLANQANAMQQQQFDRNMNWLRAQYYDTGQMKRAVEAYRNAGLNPALAYGSPNAVGSVGAPSSSQYHVAQTEAGHVDPVQIGDALSESVNHSVSAYMNDQLIQSQVENTNEDTQTKRINNFTQAERNLAEIQLLVSQNEKILADKSVSDETKKSIRLQNKMLRKQIRVYSKQMDAYMKRPYKENDLLDAQKADAEARADLANAQKLATEMGINLTAAQTSFVYQQIRDMIERLNLDKGTAQVNSAYIRNQVIHMINQDADAWESLGISKELTSSQKFKNYVTGILEGFGVGAGVYSGVRSFKNRPAPLKPEPYITPWSEYRQ